MLFFDIDHVIRQLEKSDEFNNICLTPNKRKAVLKAVERVLSDNKEEVVEEEHNFPKNFIAPAGAGAWMFPVPKE